MFWDAVKIQPHGSEAFRLDEIIGGHECVLDIAAAFHPQKILKLDSADGGRTWIEAVRRIHDRSYLAIAGEFRKERYRQARLSGAAGDFSECASCDRKPGGFEQYFFGVLLLFLYAGQCFY